METSFLLNRNNPLHGLVFTPRVRMEKQQVMKSIHKQSQVLSIFFFVLPALLFLQGKASARDPRESSVKDLVDEKLCELFGREFTNPEGEVFLAIHWPGLPLSTEELRFIDLDSPLAQKDPVRAHAARGKFAVLANSIPEGDGTQLAGSGRHVWAEYDRVLRNATVLPRETSEADEKALLAARTVLFRRVGDAFVEPREESAKMEAYRHYAALYTARIAARRVVELGDAPGSQLETMLADEKQALHAWRQQGYKSEVEAAQATIEQVTGANPYIMWADWKDAFRRSRRTNAATDSVYYDTYMYPTSFYEDQGAGCWTKVSIVSDAGDAMSRLGIGRISFEVARTQIVRPWFEPNLIASRYWEWGASGMADLSDGGRPPRGSMTAYPVEVVFARNVRVSSARKAAGDTESKTPDDGLQLIAFVCRRTPKSPNPPLPGRISIRNKGGYVARFTVKYEVGEKTKTVESGSLWALQKKSVELPWNARKISAKVEVATFIDTWTEKTTLKFDEPVTRSYELSGTTGDIGFAEVKE
jgi:hypothetical protein